jgi:protein TonB
MQNEELLRASLDDIVFENRNKSYGAYFLRQIYNKHLTRAILISSAMFVLFISMPLISKYLTPADDSSTEYDVTPVDLTPPPLDPDEPPPPPPDIPPPPLRTTLEFTPPVIAPDEEVPIDEFPPDTAFKEAQAGTTTQQGNTNDPLPGDAPGDLTGEAEPKFYVAAEIMPKFPGGEEAMMKFIRDNMVYPPMAMENNIEGKVVLTFIVNKEGAITDIEILKKLGWGCEEAAIKVVKKMPAWSPGRQNGRNVAVKYNLPITFQLR